MLESSAFAGSTGKNNEMLAITKSAPFMLDPVQVILKTLL
jgi:hypothetical protein